ncbi:MAG: class C sortase [Parvimonas sp.]|uniref:class C sortase n=1 Tax=Parvimonas sp. TaxID=1944660 RepID=UPI0025D43048|nr:class C sortase [Parvimonas sp.]MCI5997990.1 class C sortase [Parvimonas sp.]MDY3051366.1 class C sortase [Parvimonas sp.]
MNKKSKIKIIGYFLMLLGIFMPLYAFGNLTWSNFKSKYEYQEFKKNQNIISKDEITKMDIAIKNYNDKLNGNVAIVDPFDSEQYKTSYDVKKDNPDMIFAYIRIPDIDVLQPIRLDASYEHLATGVAHVDGTALPVGGVGNRSVIAGHRGFYKDIMFLNLGDLKVGDEVFVDRLETTLKYVVTGTEIIKPYEWEKLNPIEDKDVLTLLTCDPITPPSPYRLLVNCERVQEEKLNKDIISEKESKTQKTSPKIRYITIGIYAVTFILSLLFVIVFYKMIKYVMKK